MRLDAYLAEKYPEHSRSVWQKYLQSGFVTVNGRIANKTASVTDNDKIVINIPPAKQKPLDLPIIYEDDNVVVINKPAGVLTHSKGALNDEFTVADFIRLHAKNTDLADNNRFGIVHRLDRATSGVIIGAKTETARKLLQKQFADRKAKKTYLAIVENPPLKPAARIDLPIARDPKHPSRFRIDPKGKPAVTDYKVLRVLPNGTALLGLKPLTGRTHQLRVHLAYIGTPIVGDPIYHPNKMRSYNEEGRMMLHAKELEITIPEGERKTFAAELPKDWR